MFYSSLYKHVDCLTLLDVTKFKWPTSARCVGVMAPKLRCFFFDYLSFAKLQDTGLGF